MKLVLWKNVLQELLTVIALLVQVAEEIILLVVLNVKVGLAITQDVVVLVATEEKATNFSII
jgi:hypothetical protein